MGRNECGRDTSSKRKDRLLEVKEFVRFSIVRRR